MPKNFFEKNVPWGFLAGYGLSENFEVKIPLKRRGFLTSYPYALRYAALRCTALRYAA